MLSIGKRQFTKDMPAFVRIFYELLAKTDNFCHLGKNLPSLGRHGLAKNSFLLVLAGGRHILSVTFATPSMASLTADFVPSSVLTHGQNTPLREHPVHLPPHRES